MLAQEIANRHPGRVRFVEENFGESPLAERFGIEQYPAVFVDEALVAGPWDFYEWPDTPEGRYVPWVEAASRERFASDLASFVERALRGEANESVRAPEGLGDFQVAALPAFESTTLSGERLSSEDLRGRVTLVELWATWCPPCQSTLSFLGELERAHSDSLTVVAIAVSSEEDEVRQMLADTPGGPADAVMGSPELLESFGGVLAVPTLMVFDSDGRTAGVFYGAPPDLHERVQRLVDGLAMR